MTACANAICAFDTSKEPPPPDCASADVDEIELTIAEFFLCSFIDFGLRGAEFSVISQ